MLAIITTHPIQYQVPIWKELAKRGVDFEVWYLTDFGTKPSFDVQFGKTFAWDMDMLSGYPYRFLEVNKGATPNGGFANLRLASSIDKLIHEKHVTHVWINGWQVLAYWQAMYVAKSMGVKIWLRAETNDIKPETGWHQPIRKLMLSWFFSGVTHFLCIGAANRRFYKRYNIVDSRLFKAPYCVDNGRFYTQSLKFKQIYKDLKAEWSIPKESFVFLFIGKFIEKKRPLDIIKAAHTLQGNRPIHLLFVGSGHLQAEIEIGLNLLTSTLSNITYSIVGFLNQSEVSKAYAMADCMILPSDFGETWGLVVNEAMSTGVPCIVSNQVGCAEDLVLPIHPNLVFQTGNIAQLAQAMNWILDHEIDESEVLRIVADFDFSKTVDQVVDLL